MTPKSYHTPPQPVTTRARCPVCHKDVYSQSGIHPQCAIRLADPPRPKAKPPGSPGHAVQAAKAPERTEGGVIATPSDSEGPEPRNGSPRS